MFARVVVVEHNLYNVIVLQDKRVGVAAVNGGVVGEVAGGEGSVEGGNFGTDVGDVVEEGADIVC